MKKLRPIIIIIICITLFLTIISQRHYLTTIHRDGWEVIVSADKILDSGYVDQINPYTEKPWSYPPGSWVFAAVLQTGTGLDFPRIAQLFPALNFVLLGLMIFLVARYLFDDDWAAIACIAFTPLIFSNVTIMGHFYFVPLAFAVTLSMLFFKFYLEQKWFWAVIVFLAIAATHASTIVFTTIAAGLYLLFNKRYWKKIPLFAILAVIFFAALKLTRNVDVTEKTVSFVEYITSLTKDPPFISIYLTISIIFLVFLAFGFLFIAMRERKARLFLIPIFFFLVFDLFMYWNYQGFFIVYRRLIYYLLIFIPFFVGYGAASLAYVLTHLFSHAKRSLYTFILSTNIILVFMLLLLVPAAVKIHIGSHPTYVLVTEEEQELFTQFGRIHPKAYVATNHLQSLSLPYYNLKPLQVPPDVGSIYLDTIMPCFVSGNITCITNFFNSSNFTYLYTQTMVNSTNFRPAFQYQDLIIYEFVRNSSKNTGGAQKT